jgi:hypothetical protein
MADPYAMYDRNSPVKYMLSSERTAEGRSGVQLGELYSMMAGCLILLSTSDSRHEAYIWRRKQGSGMNEEHISSRR